MLKKTLLVALLAIIVASCSSTKETKTKDIHFFIGTMSGKQEPLAKGIYTASMNNKGKFSNVLLSAKLESPTFLHKTPNNYVLATSSSNKGMVNSFALKNNKLTAVSSKKTGTGPCFVNQKGAYVLTANYGGGSVTLHSINNKGELSESLDIQKHSITTPSTHKRQKKPFAHSCYFEPNSNNIIAADLGANKILFSHIDKTNHKLIPNAFSELEMPANSGPRHIAFHPNKEILYVVNELNATVTVVKKNVGNNSYNIVETVKTLPEDFTSNNTSAHLVISNDAHFLYMTNRGHDSIATFKIEENGQLTFVDRVSVHGKHPRNFALTPNNQFVLIANRDTNNICSFKRNATTGKLTFVDEVTAPKPVFILF